MNYNAYESVELVSDSIVGRPIGELTLYGLLCNLIDFWKDKEDKIALQDVQNLSERGSDPLQNLSCLTPEMQEKKFISGVQKQFPVRTGCTMMKDSVISGEGIHVARGAIQFGELLCTWRFNSNGRKGWVHSIFDPHSPTKISISELGIVLEKK